MKKVYLFAFIALLSCGKDEGGPDIIDETKSPEQLKRDEEGASTKVAVKQGLAVEIYKGYSKIVGDIIIYDQYDDISEVDFEDIREVRPLMRSAKERVSKEKYKEYGFELPEGKYLVFISTSWPQTCVPGAMCAPPLYFSVKEFEVLNGSKTTVKIDFKGIDDFDNPSSSNYVYWN